MEYIKYHSLTDSINLFFFCVQNYGRSISYSIYKAWLRYLAWSCLFLLL